MKNRKKAGLRFFLIGCAVLAAAAVLKFCAPGLPEQIREALSPTDNTPGFETSMDCFGKALSDDVGVGKAFSMLFDGGEQRG